MYSNHAIPFIKKTRLSDIEKIIYMKEKLLLFFIPILSTLTTWGQTSGNAALYNEGKMAVFGEDTTKTILYIVGDMIVTSDPANQNITSQILVNNGKILLVGNFRNNVKNGLIFDHPADRNDEGLFEFRSDEAQTIKTDGTTYNTIPSKQTSYIDFPHLRINNPNHVTVTPEIGMKTKDISLSQGWLILESRRTNQTDLPGSTDPSKLDSLIRSRTQSAHLFVDGAVTYAGWSNTDINKRGFIEVNIALDPLDTNFDYKSLVAFGSPYDSIKADYFMYNFLVSPSSKGFLGERGTTIPEPTYTLRAGVGHVLGIDLRGSNKSHYPEADPTYPTIDFDHRATDMYTFNRFRYANDPLRNKNQIFGTSATTSPYQMEKLNTRDIKIELATGFNYLANPYTAPLDVSDLTGLDMAGDWGVLAYNDTKPNTERQMINRVWVLNGDASARSIHEGATWIKFNYKYYVAKSVGGTYLDEDGRPTIAPLQMFVVYATQPCEITIPASKRTMGNSLFIRRDESKRTDDFVFEILDATTKTSDRVSVVLRTGEEIATNGECENVARLKHSGEEGESKLRSFTANDNVTPTISSLIYTKDDNNDTPLSVKFLPLAPVTSTNMYLTPSTVKQEISIRGLRLKSMSEIVEIWLEDKLKGNKTLMSEGTIYTTVSDPKDPKDRFVLHFYTREGVGIDNGQSDVQEIWAHYSDETLTVSGFTQSDFGGTIHIYDIEGRTLSDTKIDNSTMEINIALKTGAYILKVTGRKPYFTKFLAK